MRQKVYPAAKRRNWNECIPALGDSVRSLWTGRCSRAPLGATIRRFPSMAGRLRRGMFWYYLEEVPRPPKVKQGTQAPSGADALLTISGSVPSGFCYRNRIAVEFSLTDGNGGLVFEDADRRISVQKYGAEIPAGRGCWTGGEEPREEELADKFSGAYRPGRQKPRKGPPSAWREPGRRMVSGHITTGILDWRRCSGEASSMA